MSHVIEIPLQRPKRPTIPCTAAELMSINAEDRNYTSRLVRIAYFEYASRGYPPLPDATDPRIRVKARRDRINELLLNISTDYPLHINPKDNALIIAITNAVDGHVTFEDFAKLESRP